MEKEKMNRFMNLLSHIIYSRDRFFKMIDQGSKDFFGTVCRINLLFVEE